MTIFDALTNSLQEQRQANSVAGTLGPYLGTTGGPSGGVLSQFLGNILGIQSPTPSPPVSTAGSGGLAASATSTSPSMLSMLTGAPAPITSAPNPPPAPLSYAPTSAPAPAAPRAPTYAPAPSGPLPSFAAAGGVPGQDNASQALAFYQSKGLPPMSAAALVGGFQGESGKGLNTNALAVGDGSDGSNSVGIAQWNGARAQGLRQFAAANNLDPSDLNTQLQYSWMELNGPYRGTLQALMNPGLNPGTATAAALGYEQPAGWSAQNPYGAKSFGIRARNTVQLASSGFSAPFDGSPMGPNPSAFTPDPSQGGALPTMVASGLGSQLSPATPFPQRVSIPSAASATPAVPQQIAQQQGAQQRLAAYADPSSAATAPASQAISAAAPAGDPLVTIPGYPGQWNKAKVDAAPDGTDVPDDGELARAQAGAAGAPIAAPQAASAPLAPTRLAAPSPVAAPAPGAAVGGVPAQSGSGLSITPNMIRDLVQNPDTQAIGLKLFETAVTTKTPPIVQDGYVLDGRTGQLLYALPQRPQPTDAMKNYGLAQQQGYTGTFMNYQDAQQKADKSTVVEVPLPNGQFQKMAGVAGQPMSTFTPYGAPYTRQPGVNIDQRSETSSEAAYGQAQGKRFGNILDAGEAAQQTQGQLALMNDAFNQSNGQIQTGPFAQSILAGKQALLGLTGVDLGGIPESEAVQKLGFGLATSLTKEITQRPAQAEFLRALQNVPGIFMSPTGSRVMMSVLNQQAQQKIDLSQLVQVKANRDNWPAVEQAYYASHPLLSPFTGKPLSGQDVMTLAGAANAAGINPATGNSLNASSQTAANLSAARQAIAQGAPRAAVIQKLRQNGVDPSGL